MQLQWKIWLEEEEQKVFGRGPKKLLLKTDELGSLRQAAAAMEMSYSKAWRIINILEEKLEMKVLKKQIGGNEGGGSELTPEGRRLLEKYEELETKVAGLLPEIFAEIFEEE